MEETPLGSDRPSRFRSLRAIALVFASFAALVAGAVAAAAMSGNLRLLPGIGGFVAYVLLFGEAAREIDIDGVVWDHPDSGLLARFSGKSPLAGNRP